MQKIVREKYSQDMKKLSVRKQTVEPRSLFGTMNSVTITINWLDDDMHQEFPTCCYSLRARWRVREPQKCLSRKRDVMERDSSSEAGRIPIHRTVWLCPESMGG